MRETPQACLTKASLKKKSFPVPLPEWPKKGRLGPFFVHV